ncbi:ANTAR domain-containing response regulator [Aureimonas frigidaquae]|uniref:ANTAR domain-containing response regulator n=1 Tax=Aureimonas frigidaquae TaxID=424757 RepID=UPI0007847B0A|nr:ANTAR domain-containing protein [Aureimonas frigidaquae]
MSQVRPIQNFSGKCAHVATADERAMAALGTMLPKFGMHVARLSLAEGGLQPMVPQGDIVFVDGDLPDLRQLRLGPDNAAPPMPVIGLIGVEAPSRLRLLVDLGTAAFLPKPIHSGSVFSALYLAACQHERRLSLEATVEELDMRRRKRRHVIKAVTLVMRMDGLDDDAAFQKLRRLAMQARVPIETYCEIVVQRCTTQADREAKATGL